MAACRDVSNFVSEKELLHESNAIVAHNMEILHEVNPVKILVTLKLPFDVTGLCMNTYFSLATLEIIERDWKKKSSGGLSQKLSPLSLWGSGSCNPWPDTMRIK